MQFSIVLCIIIVFVFNAADSSRILAVIFSASYSHQITFRPLWKELSLRGHHVTLLTTDPMNDSSLSNITEIDLSSSHTFWRKRNMFKVFENSTEKVYEVLTYIADEQLSNPQVKSIIKNKTEHFDLLMIEGYYSAFFAFAERFNCPFIIVKSSECTSFVYSEIRNPVHSIINPDYTFAFKSSLSFSQRILSFYYDIYLQFHHNYYVFPSQQMLVTKHFGSNYSLIQDVFKNYSLFFMQTETVLSQIRPLLPNFIRIGGGMHLKNIQPLPIDLQHTIDSAEHGVIYFSLGSVVKSVDITEQFCKTILDTFRELPYTVLWKFENDSLSNKPDNVIISKWYPQQDILRHPNVKLFITQGGALSIYETIYNRVPLIGIPVITDQRFNINKMVSNGCGLLIEYKDATKEDFLAAIMEVINNPKYRINIEKLAELINDQPETALNRAVWWTEYVLRHKGAPHLRNSALDLPIYQYYFLDVISFSLMILGTGIYVLITMFKLFLKYLKRLYVEEKEKTS